MTDKFLNGIMVTAVAMIIAGISFYCWQTVEPQIAKYIVGGGLSVASFCMTIAGLAIITMAEKRYYYPETMIHHGYRRKR